MLWLRSITLKGFDNEIRIMFINKLNPPFISGDEVSIYIISLVIDNLMSFLNILDYAISVV